MAETNRAIWYEVIVVDPEGVSGASVASFVEPIITNIGAKVVIPADLIGSCPGLIDHERQALVRDEFLRRVADATQYDWAFFFLYSIAPASEDLGNRDYKSLMADADTTIRLADDYYFYVYTRDEALASKLRQKYPAAEYKAATFQELDIPY